jgi:c-di-GMP phosphodiesterase
MTVGDRFDQINQINTSTETVLTYKIDTHKDDVVMDLSYELRTLLTGLQGSLGLLEGGYFGSFSDNAQRMLEIATGNVERLLRLTRKLENDSTLLNSLSTSDLAQLRLEEDLCRALSRNEFHLYYQPIVSLSGITTRVTGFEALLRWQHPSLGMIFPDQFIPLAEATDLIIPIGNWVICQACQQLRKWQHQLPPSLQSLSVSVNLSSKQLSNVNLVHHIEEALQNTGLSAQRMGNRLRDCPPCQEAHKGSM